MFKGILLGIILGVIGVAASVYLYFANGNAPVAVTASDMPFERTFARLGLHAYLGRNCLKVRELRTTSRGRVTGRWKAEYA